METPAAQRLVDRQLIDGVGQPAAALQACYQWLAEVRHLGHGTSPWRFHQRLVSSMVLGIEWVVNGVMFMYEIQ